MLTFFYSLRITTLSDPILIESVIDERCLIERNWILPEHSTHVSYPFLTYKPEHSANRKKPTTNYMQLIKCKFEV